MARIDAGDLGTYEVAFASDGFHVCNEADGDIIEIPSNGIDGTMTLATSTDSKMGDVATVAVGGDGLEVSCELTVIAFESKSS